jgi:hypothetical protein
MQCEKCERPKTVKLADGRMVCTWCNDWTIECEARHLLRMPLAERRAALAAREKKRRPNAIEELKKAMVLIHGQSKSSGSGSV